MTDYTNIDSCLSDYSDAFDFYMDCGEMPPSMPPDDCLAGYMKEVIDNNPQIDGSDPTWVEVLKDELISFFSALLEQFRAMQLEAMKELAMIERFRQASIDKKREMWPQVVKVIEGQYSKYEVNMAGYAEQFKGSADNVSIFSAMTGDWEAACKEHLEARQQQMLNISKKRFESLCQTAGSKDYEAKKKIDSYVHRYPQLREIIDMIGRDKDPSKEEKDTIIYKFLPMIVAKNTSVEEIDRVESGNNLERVLPAELSMPDDLFYKRYATKELQQFSCQGKDKPRKVEDRKLDPRLTKGPIIVSIDTSGSMSGQPEKIAFSLLRQLLRMAKRQKRPCFLISFSVRAQSIDLAKPRNWNRLDQFLENGFSGGTDGEQMLSQSLDLLQKGTYEMADVLVISDLQFAAPRAETRQRIDKEKSLGTRFYALQIGNWRHDYNEVMNKIWVV